VKNSLDNMLIVSGIIFTTYGIFSLLTNWNNTASFEWPTILIIIIGVTLLPVGKMIKKQQSKKDMALEILKKRHVSGEISDEEFNEGFNKFS
jgi:uncharacterized membrane protein|tara:strand:+ start:1256 stop:1531 length:276 start_codon:yes stop_codon:yes gene_type:complete